MKKVYISQSNYIPWKGFFKSIADVDIFVVYDDVQYTKRDWRNRNLVKTPNGVKWITIPVEVKGKYQQKISETEVSDPNWANDHLKIFKHVYAKAPHFKEVFPEVEEWYSSSPRKYLSEINCHFINSICNYFCIKTKIILSGELSHEADKTARLVNICKQLGATDYYSGPAAKSYLEELKFINEGIQVHYFNYEGFPVYNQVYPPFNHHVTVLDMIFHLGKNSKKMFDLIVE